MITYICERNDVFMEKFVPFNKLSKKKQRELNLRKRNTWGTLNPVTRKSENPKAYNRRKAKKWSDNFISEPFCLISSAKQIKYSKENINKIKI